MSSQNYYMYEQIIYHLFMPLVNIIRHLDGSRLQKVLLKQLPDNQPLFASVNLETILGANLYFPVYRVSVSNQTCKVTCLVNSTLATLLANLSGIPGAPGP